MNRHTLWAKAAKARLIESLGGRCWACGSTHDLEIDHPNGREWKPAEFSFRHRVTIYIREAAEGKIRLLCFADNRSHRFEGVTLPPPAGVVPVINGAMQPF